MATIRAYHSTNSDFKRLDDSFLGANTDDNATDYYWAQTAHLGFWFNVGGNLSIAYNKQQMECLLEIENPIEVDSIETLALWIESQEKTGEELRSELQEQGYDSIIVTNDEEYGGVSYVVFDAANIEIKKTMNMI
ncbi:MAG: hypothetical protein HDS14_00365 [Bacteroides sp.]|nr:hypothetical protein [Bacteroides sp.]